MHKMIAHGNEAANCECMSITMDTLGEIKKMKLKILAYFFWMCCVVTEFVYANTIILFNFGE